MAEPRRCIVCAALFVSSIRRKKTCGPTCCAENKRRVHRARLVQYPEVREDRVRRSRLYYAENRAALLADKRAKYHANREHISAVRRQKRRVDGDAERARDRERDASLGRKEAARIWRRLNREKLTAYERERQRRMRAAYAAMRELGLI